MTKKLLVLGAGRGQVGLIKAAKNFGVEVVAVTKQGQTALAEHLADRVRYADIACPDEVLAVAKEERPDGIATSCLDTGVISLGRVCDELGLVGLTECSAKLCADKNAMKEAFLRGGVKSAQYVRVSDSEELARAITTLTLPVIVKATDLQGSRGIYIAHSPAEAHAGFEAAMKETKKDYCVVEEFIVGNEFGAQAFVYQGEVFFVLPHGDKTFMSHTAVPVGHSVPLEGTPGLIAKTKEVVVKAIRALGLDNCAVNVDMIERDGEVYMIELTGRVGANGLPELTSIYYGLNYYEIIARMALGEEPTQMRQHVASDTHEAGIVEMYIAPDKQGVLKSLTYVGKPSDKIYALDFFKHKGDEIRQFSNSNDCIGQIIVRGKTLAECENHLDEVMANIEMELA